MNIYIDIETRATRRADIMERVTADVRPPGTLKKADSIAAWWTENGDAAKDEALAKTGLNGAYGEVFCIGFAINDADIQIVHHDDEKALLEEFQNSLNAEILRDDTANGWTSDLHIFIGHNVEFDLRFIWQRAKVTGATFNVTLPLERYSRTSPYRYDTMTEWAGYGNRIKQSDLELAFGLERNDPLPHGGADVHQAIKDGRIGDVFEHCHEDIRLLREIHKRMTG